MKKRLVLCVVLILSACEPATPFTESISSSSAEAIVASSASSQLPLADEREPCDLWAQVFGWHQPKKDEPSTVEFALFKTLCPQGGQTVTEDRNDFCQRLTDAPPTISGELREEFLAVLCGTDLCEALVNRANKHWPSDQAIAAAAIAEEIHCTQKPIKRET